MFLNFRFDVMSTLLTEEELFYLHFDNSQKNIVSEHNFFRLNASLF